MNVNLDTLLEWASVIFGLLYLILLIEGKIWCWYFGIIGSGLSIILFYRTGLYSESILYIYYVLIGIYGLYAWGKKAESSDDILDRDKSNTHLQYQEWPFLHHITAILICLLSSAGLGYFFEHYTDAKNAYLDSFTTVFSFFASYLETRKVVSAWLYWIILNGLTIYLYNLRELDIYALLTVVYFIASFLGFIKWRKLRSKQENYLTS